jgi:putative hydrolase of the HAD superfamily
MPAAILVDLDDTLLDDRYAMGRAITALRESHGVGRSVAARDLVGHWLAITAVHWKRYRNGELTMHEQRRERLRDLLREPLSATEADALFERYLAHYRDHWRLAPGASAFLERTSNLPKALVSNGEHSQVLSKVAALGLHAHFVAILTPEVGGAAKPDLAIFRQALARVGTQPGETLMVGDSYEADILPAQALGMATFHVCNTVPGRTIADAADAA